MKKYLTRMFTLSLLLAVALLSTSISCNDSSIKLEIIKIYKKEYKMFSSFKGEVYVKINTSQKPDTAILKSACRKLLPEISPDLMTVKIHVLQGDKKISEVLVEKDIADYKFKFFDTDQLIAGYKNEIARLAMEKLWSYPDSLIGIWNVHGMGFIYFYRENGMLKTQTCHYDGTMQVNKNPIVNKITINNKEYLKHVWSSDFAGPDEQFYQINEFNDLIFFAPHDFMQYIFERIE